MLGQKNCGFEACGGFNEKFPPYTHVFYTWSPGSGAIWGGDGTF